MFLDRDLWQVFGRGIYFFESAANFSLEEERKGWCDHKVQKENKNPWWENWEFTEPVLLSALAKEILWLPSYLLYSTSNTGF